LKTDSLNTNISKYRLPFILALFLICAVNVFFLVISPEKLIITTRHLPGNETIDINKQNLELKADDSPLVSVGLKVESAMISCPLSFNSGDNYLFNLNHLISIYSKKKSSLFSHSNLINSKTLHLSPLITRLQI